jgi:steroid 5-alpha reductase family enzyme
LQHLKGRIVMLWIVLFFFAGWVITACIMTGIWFLQRATRDAGWVDAAWAGSIGLLALLSAFFMPDPGPRRCLVTAFAVFWGGRLALHIALRTARSKSEDSRYQKLREEWGDQAQRQLFIFYQIQALVAAVFAIPIMIAQKNPTAFPNIWDGLGIAVFMTALIGEIIADRQLAEFKKEPRNKGKTCRQGLWRYSRHPNYFFEWLHWWTYCFLAIGTWAGWITLIGPVLMLNFLIRVTGIPISEEQSLKSRPDYAEYKRTTSAFIPWPPKSDDHQVNGD